MISEVTLRLIFYGLVALVPNDAEKPDAISFVLVDGSGHQYLSDGCKVPEHRALVYAAAKECKDFTANTSGGFDEKVCSRCANCRPPQNVTVSGAWPVMGSVLTVSIEGEDGEFEMATDLRSSGVALPRNKSEAADIGWIPEVGLGNSFAPECLFGDPDCPVAARFIVDQGRLVTCHLSEFTADSADNKKVCAFDLRAISSSIPTSDPPQAMADAVMVSFSFPETKKITVSLRNIGEDVVKEKIELKGGRIIESSQSKFIDLWVLNVPPSAAAHEHCSPPGVDGHFELFYNLSEP